MKIQWLGHACFLITSAEDVKIITDPYQAKEKIGLVYGEVNESADIVTVSHSQHFDHAYTEAVHGNPMVLKDSAVVKGITFKAIATFHDNARGAKKGENTIFVFTMNGVRVCHLGDLGHLLNAEQVEEIGPVDVLMCPVGGFFTIGPAEADLIISAIKPGIVIPMHFRNDRCPKLAVAGVDEFLKNKRNVVHTCKSEIEIKAETLPAATQIMVLQPAR